MIDKAYILYTTSSYLDTVKACVKSLNVASGLPIYVYTVNFKAEIPGATTVYWECDSKANSSANYINREDSEIYKLLIQRPKIILHALEKIKTVAYIDSDSIATKNVDLIFSYFPKDDYHPYFVEGIYDYLHLNGRGGAESKEDLSTTLEHPACQLFNVDQTIRERYRQTGYFVAGQNCKPFLEEWWEMCNHPEVLHNPQRYAPYHEETIVNVLLWKCKYLKGLPYIYVNGDFVGKVEFGKGHVKDWVRFPDKPEELMFFHGVKYPETMFCMIDKLYKLRILYVAPHLSTGGMPQYLYEQILYFAKDNIIEVVDVTNSGGDSFVVQKNRISNLVPVHTKPDLLKLVNTFKPDIIHYQEIPEHFLPKEVLKELFKSERTHFNVVTTHSSYTQPHEISYHPDRYVFVCEWSKQQFEGLGIDSEVWELPVINHLVDKKLARKELGFNPDRKHVVHVGLFTPGKNQAEIFELAKMFPEVDFHFVGNQAGNFKHYWEPLMKDKPANCIIWGERDDVHMFYSAADVFYFPSKFELAPVSIREALGHGLHCMFRKLHTYLDAYDNNPKVTYITDDVNVNAFLLSKVLENDI